MATDPIDEGTDLGTQTGVASSLSPYIGPYATEMLGQGLGAAGLPYVAYTGPLTAGSSALQKQQFQGLAGLTIPTEGMTAFSGSMADPASVNMYMNPYLQNVLDPQLKELRRQADISRVADASRLTQAGAFGGGRQAIMEAEGRRNLLDQLDKTLGEGYYKAFGEAREGMKFDRDTQEGDRQYGLAALDRMGTAGATQRDITAEGVEADKLQFEEERDFVYKMPVYLQSLLQELPLSATDVSFATPSALSSGAASFSDILALLYSMSGMQAPDTTPTTPTTPEEQEQEGVQT